MGKRRGAVSGLSLFAKEAFGDQLLTPSALNDSSAPPSKRRKVELLRSSRGRYDATGLVPFYREEEEVPAELRKYFSQRLRLFSLYPRGALLDPVGWFSVTPEAIAANIAERCRCDTILDAFCGVGGNAIQFALRCERVIALDTSTTRLRLARHNAALYGVADRIEFILADYVDFARSYASLLTQTMRGSGNTATDSVHRKIDVVFLSPPWGGPGYIDGAPHPEYSLRDIQPIPGKELFDLTRQITPHVAYYLPRNVSMEEVAALLPEKIEVEEQWMGNKLKAVCCYFGGLVSGQEDMW
ncbi:S-adenosyl-L-methionine-dependent methyltransferase [Gloeophyllum trabeum ATCC 11539]|uniref:Trimethylguanosine synthase n=1 Tax=Gloeophyllum trabeum (strain ATCC 11539 / FP-39264 / Madison 617) TaxID=670483 RepID=S7RNM5_GLOTA|nr:S-adenosyl-L-methionine-dependent methyltransferase [Gloeophyllum trabeum ATCC 11539]EPQ56095.1 S-adenosyl-L-methionine-dependent methyltransferase [Gloeophyllum trabeum ATCC 11539]